MSLSQTFIKIIVAIILAASLTNLSYAQDKKQNEKLETRQLAHSLTSSDFELKNYQTLIQRIEQRIDKHNLTDYELSYYRSQLISIALHLKTITDKVQTKFDREKKLLDLLQTDSTGKNKISTKDTFINQQIKRYQQKLTLSQTQLLTLKYFQARIDYMISRLQDLRMSLRSRQTFRQNSPLYTTSAWQQSIKQLKVEVVKNIELKQAFLSKKGDLYAILLFILTTLALLLFRRITQHYIKPHPGPALPTTEYFSAFNRYFLIRAFIPGVIYYFIGIFLYEIVGQLGNVFLMRNLFRCAGFLVIFIGLINAAYQIYFTQPASFKRPSKRSFKTLTVLLTFFIFVNNVDIFAFQSLTFLQFNADIINTIDLVWSVIFITFLWPLLFRIDSDALQAKAAQSATIKIGYRYFSTLRLLLLIITLTCPILLLFGLTNLSTNILINTLQTIIAVALFNWIHSLVKFYIPKLTSFIQSHYLIASESQLSNDQKKEYKSKTSLVNYWIVTIIDVILVLSLIILVVLVWGLHYEVLLDWFNLIFIRGIPVGKNATFSLSHLLRAIFIFVSIFWLTRAIQYMLHKRVLSYLRTDKGTKHAVKTTVGYVGLGAAVVMFIYALGINVTTLTFIISGLSVGIGIGLQDFFKNFFAGMILLIERPVKIGDMVIVNNDYGIIKKIRLRATEFETFNNTTFIIPNSDFVIKPISNETINPISRAVIDVGISYDEDPKQAMQMLLDIANQHPSVLKQPASNVAFMDFADSALSLQLRVYTKTDDRAQTSSDLRLAILEAFKQAGIEIPYPQSDIHIKEFHDFSQSKLVKLKPKSP